MRAANSSSGWCSEMMSVPSPDGNRGGVGTSPTAVRKGGSMPEGKLSEAIEQALIDAVKSPMNDAEIDLLQKKIETVKSLAAPS